MPIPTRRPWLSKVFRSPYTYEIGMALASGYLAISKFVQDTKPGEPKPWVLIGIAASVCGLSIAKAYSNWQSRERDESVYDLEGCLHCLHAFASQGIEGEVRVTIHVPVADGQQLEQLLDYVGAKPNNRAGRRFAAQSGVIGECYRRAKVVAAERKNDNYNQYVRELVDCWHFTKQDAMQCNPGTKSWLAVPLLGEGENPDVQGVVYMDSVQQNCFPDDKLSVIVSMCAGIARFVAKRY